MNLREIVEDVGVPIIKDADASYVDPGEMFYHPPDNRIYVRHAGHNKVVAVPDLPSTFNDFYVKDKGVLDALRSAIHTYL
jgi:hypothetical protein